MSLITVGKIINTHGIKGDVKVFLYDDFEAGSFKKNVVCTLTSSNSKRSVKVKSVKPNGTTVLLHIEGVDTMNDAELLRDYVVGIEEEDLGDKEDQGYYHFELKGCEVFSSTNELIGIVSGFETTTRHDVLRVSRDNEKDALIPYVDAFIIEVDIESKKIIVDVIEGLL